MSVRSWAVLLCGFALGVTGTVHAAGIGQEPASRANAIDAAAPSPPALTGSGGTNAPEHRDKPVVILVSVDGYRWDYPDRFPSPAIRRLVEEGQRAERLVPVWPTLTFPNHYSLVTGLPPAEHGLVGNEFPADGRWYAIRDRSAVEDGRFYGGEPLWVTAERNGMVSASFFWVGSEAPIGGLQPTHWYRYDKTIPAEARVNQVLAWLDEPPETRPHFITLYFEQLDDQSHWSGVGSPEFRQALETVDRAIGRLLDGIDALPADRPVYLVLVSDHGQMPFDDAPPFVLEDHLYLEGLALIDKGPAVYAWQGTPDRVAARKLAETVNAAWPDGRAYTRDTAPAHWGLADNERFPDLVFQADAGKAVVSRHIRLGAITAGDHGWAPEVGEMHGMFIVRGPGITPGSRRGATPVTAVQPLVLDWLGLETGAPGTVEDPALAPPEN